MYRAVCSIGLALLCSCGGGDGGVSSQAPTTLDGTWNATSLVAGSAITLVLTEQDSKIAGVGTYRVEAGARGAMAVAGVHSGAQAALELAYDNGSKASYAASVRDADHMSGVLVFEGGGSSAVQFVRQ